MTARAAASIALLVSLLVTAAPAPASAQPLRPTSRDLARQAIFRARRAFAVGPSVGLAGGLLLDGGEGLGLFDFGIAFRAFAIGIPTAARIRELVDERTRIKVREKIRDAMARGEPEPSDADLAAFVREIAAEVRAQVLEEFWQPPRLLERPRFAADLEGGRWFGNGEGWMLRAGAGVGLAVLTLGPTVALYGDSGTVLFTVGGEAAVHLLPGKGPRSLVIDLYLRGDFAVNHRDEIDFNLLSVGTRLIIDVL